MKVPCPFVHIWYSNKAITLIQQSCLTSVYSYNKKTMQTSIYYFRNLSNKNKSCRITIWMTKFCSTSALDKMEFQFRNFLQGYVVNYYHLLHLYTYVDLYIILKLICYLFGSNNGEIQAKSMKFIDLYAEILY